MKPDDVRAMLEETLEDRRLSRAERQAISQIFGHLDPTPQTLAVYRKMAFDLARQTMGDTPSREVIGWLEDIVKVLQPSSQSKTNTAAEAHFSPGNDCQQRIIGLMKRARQTIDICVFTITDNRISEAIVDAHQRKIAVRIITDDEKSRDLGSDIDDLARAGIPVRMDRSQYHMHHKFAIVDGTTLLTGSYNWTRSAAEKNEENFIITSDVRLVEPFAELFETLWTSFA